VAEHDEPLEPTRSAVDELPGGLARQTGLPVGYRRRIKTGLAVPHPMSREGLQAEPTTPSALR
jgi:hypothetical protein